VFLAGPYMWCMNCVRASIVMWCMTWLQVLHAHKSHSAALVRLVNKQWYSLRENGFVLRL
jgi:hypothetical protein